MRIMAGDAMLTAAGPGQDTGGNQRLVISSVPIKQCVAPVSSKIMTLRGTDGVQRSPETTVLKVSALPTRLGGLLEQKGPGSGVDGVVDRLYAQRHAECRKDLLSRLPRY